MSQVSLEPQIVEWNPFKMLDVDYRASAFSSEPLAPERLALRCFLIEEFSAQQNRACRSQLRSSNQDRLPVSFLKSDLARQSNPSPLARFNFAKGLMENGELADAQKEIDLLMPVLVRSLDYNLTAMDLLLLEGREPNDIQLNYLFSLSPVDPRVRRLIARVLRHRGSWR
jgi:hypothetical protein